MVKKHAHVTDEKDSSPSGEEGNYTSNNGEGNGTIQSHDHDGNEDDRNSPAMN